MLKTGIDWDEVLPAEIYGQWKTWMEQLPQVQKFSVPRCYMYNLSANRVDLHVFVDSSEEAMAAVAY